MVSQEEILRAKILVVDDKPANVQLIEGMLRVAGYTAFDSTTNPHAVCKMHCDNAYDLILLDLQMPLMDGFQVMERLKEAERESYLPVLVITAQPDHMLRALEAGAKDFVSKPIDMAELRARVHNILEVRLLLSAAKRHRRMLETTVRELEASRETIRLKTLEEQKKSQQELDLAQETQESLLPRCVPQFESFHIHAFNQPSRYVGGDFYDFMQLSSGEWVGVLADVSGKGVPAALLSSMVLGALNMEFRSGAQPQEILKRVNQLLYDKSLPFQFVTLFLFLMGPGGEGQYISAGHTPAYVFRAASGEVERLEPKAFALGMFESACFQSRQFHLEAGDLLIVYSDGLTDAENSQEEVFGEERLLEIIRREAPAGSRAVERFILEDIAAFTENTPQLDDITFVVVEKSF